jgi:hypothetical protein
MAAHVASLSRSPVWVVRPAASAAGMGHGTGAARGKFQRAFTGCGEEGAMEWVLLLNLASTGMMIGVIWFVQVVHYPLFGRVGRDGWTDYAAAWAGLGLIAVAWASTGLLQVPRHRVLGAGNWLRTAAWTLRGALLLWMLARLLPPPAG